MESGLNVVSEGTGDCKSRLAKYYNPGSTKNMIPGPQSTVGHGDHYPSTTALYSN